MATKQSSPKASNVDAKGPFEIFQGDGTQAPPGSTAPDLDEPHSHNNSENNLESPSHCGDPLVTSGTTSAPKINSVSSLKRTPLADVTDEAVTRPRSLSNALAEIAMLKDELDTLRSKNKALKRKNRGLKGEIVAYQDALYQVNLEAGFI